MKNLASRNAKMSTRIMWIILATLISTSFASGIITTTTGPQVVELSSLASHKLDTSLTTTADDDSTASRLHENSTNELKAKEEGMFISSTSGPMQRFDASAFPHFTNEDSSSVTPLGFEVQNSTEDVLDNSKEINSTSETTFRSTLELQPIDNQSISHVTFKKNLDSMEEVDTKKTLDNKSYSKNISKHKLLYSKMKENATHRKYVTVPYMKSSEHKLGIHKMISQWEVKTDEGDLDGTIATEVNTSDTEEKDAYRAITIPQNNSFFQLNETLDVQREFSKAKDYSSITEGPSFNDEDSSTDADKTAIPETFAVATDIKMKSPIKKQHKDSKSVYLNVSEESNVKNTNIPENISDPILVSFHKINKRSFENITSSETVTQNPGNDMSGILEISSTISSTSNFKREGVKSTSSKSAGDNKPISTDESDLNMNAKENFNGSNTRTNTPFSDSAELGIALAEDTTDIYSSSGGQSPSSNVHALSSGDTHYEKNFTSDIQEEAVSHHNLVQERIHDTTRREELFTDTTSNDLISPHMTTEAISFDSTDTIHTENDSTENAGTKRTKNESFRFETPTTQAGEDIRSSTEKFILTDNTFGKTARYDEIKLPTNGEHILTNGSSEASSVLYQVTLSSLQKNSENVRQEITPLGDGTSQPKSAEPMKVSDNCSDVIRIETTGSSKMYDASEDKNVSEFPSAVSVPNKGETISSIYILSAKKEDSEEKLFPNKSSASYDKAVSLLDRNETHLNESSQASVESSFSSFAQSSDKMHNLVSPKEGSLIFGDSKALFQKDGENFVDQERPVDEIATDVEFLTEPLIMETDGLPSDYFADQSEIRPIRIELNEKVQTINDSEVKENFVKINNSKETNDKVVLETISSRLQSFENASAEASIKEAVDQTTVKTGLSNPDEVVVLYGNDVLKRKENKPVFPEEDENTSSSLNHSTIAGVGVKTTVSVSLNVSKMNDSNKNYSIPTNPDVSNENQETVKANNSVTEMKSSVIMQSKDIVDSNITTEYKNEEMPINTLKSVTLGTKPRETSTQEQQTTSVPASPSIPSNPFGLRKPRIKIDGEHGPVMNRPRPTRPTPKPRPAATGPPVVIFQRSRTRLESITSSTTASSPIISSKPFTRRPWNLVPNFANVSSPYSIEEHSVPTTTEEEEEEELPDEYVATDPTVETTLPDDEVILLKVESLIRVDKGLRWAEQLNYRNSPRYGRESKKMKRMLEVLFQETALAPRLWKIEIDGFRREKGSKSVGVDYFLYILKTKESVDKSYLISALNERLVNNTFRRYTLDPLATEFKVLHEEKISRPTIAPEDVEPPIPQWAIAVIVIGAASLIFIILFGAVTVYGRHHMRRRYNSKLNDEDMEKSFESRDWESKMGAAYENLAADGIYDVDDGNPENMKRKSYPSGGNVRFNRVSKHDSWKSDYRIEPPKRSRRSLDPTIF